LAKRGPNLVDPRLLKALEHPTRMEILSVLKTEPSSPARIQRQLENVSLNLVSHHVKVLKELGCIELVETVSKRGAQERIYRAVGSFVLSDEDWEGLTPKTRLSTTATILRVVSDELAKSLGSGKFEEIVDRHLSRSPLLLDREGWGEIVKVLTRTLDEVGEIGDKSSKRMERSGETPIPASVVIIQFPTGESEE